MLLSWGTGVVDLYSIYVNIQNKLLWQTLISNVMKITSSLCLVSFKLSLIYFAADLYYLGVAWRRKHSLLTQLIILASIEQECGNLKHHEKRTEVQDVYDLWIWRQSSFLLSRKYHTWIHNGEISLFTALIVLRYLHFQSSNVYQF